MRSIANTLRATMVLFITTYAFSSSGSPDGERQHDSSDIPRTTKFLSNNSRSNAEVFDNDQSVINEIGVYPQNRSYAFNGSLSADDEDPTIEDFLEFIYPRSWMWPLIFFQCVVFVVGLVGNCLVCVAVYRNHTMRTVTNYFIVNLAVADFLVILFCLPPSVVWDVTSTWWFGTAMCKIVLYLQVSRF